MPIARGKIEQRIAEIEQKQRDHMVWANIVREETEQQILQFLELAPDQLHTPKEIFEAVFGEKHCPYEAQQDQGCQGCEKAIPEDHVFDCEYCKNYSLLIAIANKLAQEGKITHYLVDGEHWLGAFPKLQGS